MIVVDASVVATALADDGPDGDHARQRLRSERLAAPHIIDLEVTSVIRKHLLTGALDNRRAQLALDDLNALRVQRAPHHPLIERIWELRENMSPYDASYVALAERVRVAMVTADSRLANAPGSRCTIEVLTDP